MIEKNKKLCNYVKKYTNNWMDNKFHAIIPIYDIFNEIYNVTVEEV